MNHLLDTMHKWLAGITGCLLAYHDGVMFALGLAVTLMSVYKLYLDIKVDKLKIKDLSKS